MYHPPPTLPGHHGRRSPLTPQHVATVVLGHILVIVLFRAAVWATIGERGWYLDRLVLYPVLFSVQWLLLSHRPGFVVWLLGGLASLIGAYLVILLLYPILFEPLQTLFRPQPPRVFIRREYYLIEDLLINSVLGIVIGAGQTWVLQRAGHPLRWWGWSSLTVCAFIINALWWYTTKTWHPGM